VDRKGSASTNQVGAVHAQDHEGDGAHCRLPDLAVSGAHHCEPSLSQRLRRIIVEAAKADPAGAAKLLATPEHVDCAIVLVLTGDRGLSGAYNSSAMRAGERLVRKLEDDGDLRATLQRGQEGRRLLSLPRDRPGRRFRRDVRSPDLRRRSSHRRDRRGAVRLGRGPTGALGLDALLVLGHPKRRSGAVANRSRCRTWSTKRHRRS